ncbi:hypothetical protein NEOKW01_1161 [Nematocida sp. AWRm80]|nr:hypothetical protein NEOKW01_1161 [Nematocida sp. AWRm80]
MTSIVNMQFVCEQISMPICTVLFKNKVHPRYPARVVSLFGLKLLSPYTILSLFLALWLTGILVTRTQRRYSFPARKEMLMFLYIYLMALSLDTLLFSGIVRPSWTIVYTSVVIMQLSCYVSCYVSAMCTGLIWILPNRASHYCAGLSRIFSVISLLASFCVLGGFIQIGFGLGVFALLFLVPIFFSFLFLFTQLAKLKQLNASFWAYFSILAICILMTLVALTPFILGVVIVTLSDRYVDGIVLIHIFSFLAIVNMYNLWLIDNEQEIECVNAVNIDSK